jgi:HlyD family secretion protein
MSVRRKHLWYVLGALLIGWGAWSALRPERVSVAVATAAVGPLQVTIGDEGQTRVRHRHLITAPVPGRLERIPLEVGDTVQAGMVVARLAPLPLDSRSRQQAEAALDVSEDLARMASAAVAEARTTLAQSRSDRQRGEQMAEAGALSVADLERLRLGEEVREREVEAAEARARAAGHDVEAARAALGPPGRAPTSEALSLTCEIGGRVLAIPERSARTVQPGETLLEIGDPGDLEIVVDLLSTDAVRVQPGQPLLVTGWGGPDTLAGVVRRVDPAGFTKISALGVEEQRVNVVGEFGAPPPGLGDRFRLDVRVVLWAADSILGIPPSALFRRGAAWRVFVVVDGVARERAVTVGHESEAAAEILTGLEVGERVIRHPTDRVHDGVRVAIEG